MFFKSWKNTLFLSSTWEKSTVETAQNWDRYMSELAASFVWSCVSLSCIKGKVVGGKMWLLRCKLTWTTSLSVTPCLLLDVLCFTSPALAALVSHRFMSITLWTALDGDITASEDVGATSLRISVTLLCTGLWKYLFNRVFVQIQLLEPWQCQIESWEQDPVNPVKTQTWWFEKN